MMKKANLFLILFVVSISIPSFSQVADVSALGSAITSKEAFSWIGNYKSNFGKEHSTFFGKNSLLKLISQPEVEGVYILRGLDEFNREVLLFKAANKNGFLINQSQTLSNSIHDMKNVNPEVGSLLNEEEVASLTERFRLTYPDRTPIYLYGKKGFETILKQEGAEGIQFINGLDEKGEEHLVLIGMDKNGSQMLSSIWNHGSGLDRLIDYLFGRK